MTRKIVLMMAAVLCVMGAAAERTESIPYGDMEHWVVRYITESKLLGGKTKTIYAIGNTDTIRGNVPYKFAQPYHGLNSAVWGNVNPWSVSNAYAKVMGIEKAAGTTYPEKRDNGYCCRMDSKLLDVTALGVIDLKVLICGTIFTGKTVEPVTMAGASRPYAVIDMGAPYKGHPIALQLDYKAIVEDSNEVTYAKATSNPKKREGRDCAEFYVYLQQRWEDADGNIHARRVGTGYERIYHSVPEWQNDHQVPIRWGDIRQQPDFKDYEGLNTHQFMARNSKGEMVRIQEEGWGLNEPTHIIIMLTSGKYEAFIGHEGNSLWVDNVKLVYAD